MDRSIDIPESERLEKAFAEEAWLYYFNNYLFKSRTISLKEYKLMSEKIAARSGSKQRHKGGIR